MRASALLAHVHSLNIPFKTLTVVAQNEKVTLKGEVDNQSDAEKIALAVVNVEEVSSVDNQIEVAVKEPESKYHTVVEGDWLSKIAKTYYNDATKFDVIIEVSKPMLSDPDKIYPGQVLRIPNLQLISIKRASKI